MIKNIQTGTALIEMSRESNPGPMHSKQASSLSITPYPLMLRNGSARFQLEENYWYHWFCFEKDCRAPSARFLHNSQENFWPDYFCHMRGFQN